MIQAFEECVRSHWRRLSPAPAPNDLHIVKFGGSDYPGPTTPLVFLVFANDAPRPVAMIKAARVAAGDALVAREFEQMQHVHHVLPDSMRHVVPVPLHSWRVNGRAALLASALPGTSVLVHTWGSRAAQRSAQMATALQWSRALAAHSTGEPLGLCEWIGVAGAADILDHLLRRGWRDDEIRRLEPRLREACAAQWPAAFAHGDFFPGNLLYEGQVLSGVVDWGGSFTRAPLFVDPLTYELSFAMHALVTGRIPDLGESARVHALPPIRECREDLLRLGVDLAPGSPARLAFLIAESVALGPAWTARSVSAERFDTLLRFECGLAVARE